MTATGNFVKMVVNGIDASLDGMQLTWKHIYLKNKVMPFGVGIAQTALGALEPSITVQGYINSSPNALNLFNLLALNQGGSVAPTDIEYLIAAGLGQNANPVVGDAAYMGGFSFSGDRPTMDPKGVLMMNNTFDPRGRLCPVGRVVANYSGPDNAVPATFFDHGSNAIGTLKGGGLMTHITTPTGTQATGNITIATLPIANDTVVINGATLTWKAAVSVAGDVKIGATAFQSALNLCALIYGSVTYLAAGNYLAPTAANLALIRQATYSLPAGASNTISITYKTTGVAGNAFTLAKTGTGGLAISGATLSGGVAGDVLSITLQSATTSGGSYTTRATSTLTSVTQGGDYVAIAPGTIIDEFVKLVVTGGTGLNVGIFAVYGRFFS